MNKTRRWYLPGFVVLAMLILASVGLVACGGDEATPTPTPKPTASPTPKPTASPTVAPTATPTTAPTATATPAATTPAATAAPTATAAPGGPPIIPASHVGRTAGCSACHATGIAGAPKWPTTGIDHTGFASADINTCLGCHKKAF